MNEFFVFVKNFMQYKQGDFVPGNINAFWFYYILKKGIAKKYIPDEIKSENKPEKPEKKTKKKKGKR